MKEQNSAFLAWQAPDTKDWHVVGELEARANDYAFRYTQGALSSDKFIPFTGMEQLEKTYVSNDLFPLFQNRLLSSKRHEYPKFISWLGLDENQASPINVLGRSGAMRTTDKLQMFNKILVNDNGRFEHIFFAHGLGYLSDSAKSRVNSLTKGESLKLCIDCQNDYDNHAVIIRADAPSEIIGYCPRFMARQISLLLLDVESSLTICVEKLSSDAPANYRLMCRVSGTASKTLASNMMNQGEFNIIS